jgi:hypothetical protein
MVPEGDEGDYDDNEQAYYKNTMMSIRTRTKSLPSFVIMQKQLTERTQSFRRPSTFKPRY